jgi:hypothetical protein
MYRILPLLFLLLPVIQGCNKSFQKDDLKYFSGTYSIDKVMAGENLILEDYGTVIIDEYGIGRMQLNHYPYTVGNVPVEGVFNVSTYKGGDLYIEFYGAYWLDSAGNHAHMMCQQESQLSVMVTKMKRKSMIWTFGITTSIYPCVMNTPPSGGGDVSWYLTRID